MSGNASDADFDTTKRVTDDVPAVDQDADEEALGVPRDPVPVLPTLTMPQPIPGPGDPLRDVEESEESDR